MPSPVTATLPSSTIPCASVHSPASGETMPKRVEAGCQIPKKTMIASSSPPIPSNGASAARGVWRSSRSSSRTCWSISAVEDCAGSPIESTVPTPISTSSAMTV